MKQYTPKEAVEIASRRIISSQRISLYIFFFAVWNRKSLMLFKTF